MTATVTALRAKKGEQEVSLEGREAWALAALIVAGPEGCTPITHPGPRWSSYVHKLRRRGFNIETVHEAHAGAFAGSHARYFLRDALVILEVEEAA